MRTDKIFISLIICLIAIVATSCSDNDKSSTSSVKQEVKEYSIGVIMPTQYRERWERTAKWALENINKSQSSLSKAVRFSIHDVTEDGISPDEMEATVKRMIEEDGDSAIIGPMGIANAYGAARACTALGRPLLLPLCTSAEFQRIFATSPCVFNLTESDMAQSEILLSEALLSNAKHPILIVRQDEYGNTFREWFGFQASTLGFTDAQVYVYSGRSSLSDVINEIQRRCIDEVIADAKVMFVPSSSQDMIDFCQLIQQKLYNYEFFPVKGMMITDRGFSDEVAASFSSHWDFMGISVAPSPVSGFAAAYRQRFGEDPISGEAQFYDAFLMLAYSLTACEAAPGLSLTDAIVKVVDGEETITASWLPDDMKYTMQMLQEGKFPRISGVSGDWLFDSKNHSSMLNTTYAKWVFHNGKFNIVQYMSADENSKRAIANTQIWDWANTAGLVYDDISENQQDFDYPALRDRYAVIVAGSMGWTNYRHQADALAFYQMLKAHGYDDDHILLIMEDDIANNPSNPYQGVVRAEVGGENLYHDVVVDYKPSALTRDKLALLLTETLPSTANDNVLFFWAGHGNMGELQLADRSVSASTIRNAITAMYAKGKYRKMVMMIEACFSGSIAEKCEGIPGVLGITAANAYESSIADNADPILGVFLSDSFSRSLSLTLHKQPDITLRNLYYDMVKLTSGSHVKIYNADHYGNLFRNTMQEFLGN